MSAEASPQRWLAFPAVIALVVVGVWVAGGVIADSFRLSMALVTVWFILMAVAVFLVARPRRSLAVPLVSGYLIAAGGVGGYLLFTTVREKTVNERVAVGQPISAVSSSSGATASGSVLELAGSFKSGEHETTGTASVVKLANGKRVLTLTGFSTSAGPDVRVRIVPGDTDDGGAKGNVDLGGLKGNKGNQQYELPDDFEPSQYSAVIWCRAFSAVFGWAVLEPA